MLPLRRAARALLDHRLAQFALVGALIFAVAPRSSDPREITVDREKLRALAAVEASRSTTPRSREELERAVLNRAIEDEILYREGLRLGVGEEDAIVRQRVIQKVLFLAEELDGATRVPSRDELERFRDAHADELREPPRYRLAQMFAHRRDALEGGPEHAKAEPGPLPLELDATENEIAERLGKEAASAIAALPDGTWSAPIASPYGFHLVKVIGRAPGRVPPLDDVKSKVLELYGVARREEAVRKFVTKAFASYRVKIGDEPMRALEPDRRVALRSDPSGED